MLHLRILNSSNWRRLAALALPFAMIGLLAGCPSSRRQTARTSSKRQQEDALAAVRQTVRKEHKLETFRTAVAQLNIYLSQSNDSKLAPPSSDERMLLSKQLHLSSEELSEVYRDEFSPLDVHYLDECFLFFDALDALKLDFSQTSDAATLERGRLGFDWAMRQVWLNEHSTRPLPPSFVLRMGFGNVAERIGVALAMARAIGIDAGIISDSSDPKKLEPWSIGLRIGKEIYLFDPRSGKPIAGPNARGVATLREVRANPELAKGAIQAGASNADVKAAIVNSKVWYSPPLSSLSPRMRWLQSTITLSTPILLGCDLMSDIEEFAQAGETVNLWNPDETSITRRLAHFIPKTDGGFETAPRERQLFETYGRSLIPLSQVPKLLREGVVPGNPANKLYAKFAGQFVNFQLGPDLPRDQVLRGHFEEANSSMVELLSRLTTLQKAIGAETDLDAEALQWAKDWRAALSHALDAKRSAKSEIEIREAEANVADLEKKSAKMDMLIQRSAAEPLAGMITYQLALSKHEQAERVTRLRREDVELVRGAWQNSAGWWRTYLNRFGSAAWVAPGQIAHARNLLAEAEARLAKVPAAAPPPGRSR